MNKLFLIVLLFLISYTGYTQLANNSFTVKQIAGSNQKWIQISSSLGLNSETFFQDYKDQLGLQEDSEMELVREEHESNHRSHYRFQQFFKGVKVLGAEYVLHEDNHSIYSANGRIENNITVNTQATINSIQAIEIALSINQATKYMWESEPETYPQADLLIMDADYPNQSGHLLLAYRIDLYSSAPIQKIRYYINAHTGEIINSHNVLMTCFGGGGSAHTLYHGVQNIETVEANGEYLLQDNTRGGTIVTQSAKGNQYSDTDNNWEDSSFTQKVGALDAHFGAQSTYDFYKTSFGRNGIDGKNGRILCKIIDTSIYVNAFWESSTNTANFGIGDNLDTGPLTSLDVVGHEFTHGLTQHTCGLEYLYEAGALNEAFSDIVGKTIEFKYDSANFNWLIGQKFFFKPDTAFRSMSDPNRFKNPNYYKGKHWLNGSSDNGGVHTNSGVLNYWFYILVTGQNGTNEMGKDFDVYPMGFDATIQIVYQIMKNYLTSTSYYYDAKEASLNVVESIYGKCSNEYNNVAEAWKAVGMGNGVSEGDLQLANYKIPQISCKEGLFPVEVKLINQSCAEIIPKDTEFTMTISVKQKNKIIEKYTLENDLLPGESVNYKFTSPARIDKTATLVTVEAIYINDADTSNNRFTISITKNNNSDHDFRVNDVTLTGSPCENNTFQAQIRALYNGCSPIPAGTNLDLILKYDNEVINATFKTQTTLYPGGGYRSPNFPITRNFAGYKRVLVTLNYSLDTVTANNNTAFNVVYINNSKIGYLEPFETDQFDSTLMGLRVDSFQTLSIQNSISNSSAMVFSGAKIFDASNKFIPAYGAAFSSFISANPKFTSTIYLCIDTKDVLKAFLSFDYMQKIGNAGYDTLLFNPKFAAGSRVLFRNDRGVIIGTPTFLENASRETIMRFFEQEIPITGGPVSIEITNLSLEGGIDLSNFGIDTSKDFVLMDNISIHAETVSSNDYVAQEISVYPNPFNESFKIIMKDQQAGTVYKLFNVLGSEILEGKINADVLEINSEHLPAGNYMLKTYTSSGKTKNYSLIKIGG